MEEQPTFFILQIWVERQIMGEKPYEREDTFLFDYLVSRTIQLEGPK